MTDARPPAAADAELLSAYLAGELAEADVKLLEHRLAAEPALATQLDVLADALVTLSAADHAEPPTGFTARLNDRLAAEAAGEDADAAVIPLDVARAQRRAPARWWATVGTVAAVAVAGAVMASGALRGMGGLDSGESGITAAESGADEDTAQEEADGGAADDSAAMAAPPSAPVLLDENVRLRNEDAVLRRYVEAPEVLGLLGTPTAAAADLGATFTAAVQDAPAFADGTAPAACLDTIAAEATAPLVPVRVETVRYDATSSLAYVFVTATPEADVLDRVEVWVVGAADCATQVFVQQ